MHKRIPHPIDPDLWIIPVKYSEPITRELLTQDGDHCTLPECGRPQNTAVFPVVLIGPISGVAFCSAAHAKAWLKLAAKMTGLKVSELPYRMYQPGDHVPWPRDWRN